MPPPEETTKETAKPAFQRPGKLWVDYDAYGEEMAPNARIWKKYVKESDDADKELVDVWNKTLDVILIFAALFSGISTAFVLESSKDLKPDYTQSSAQTLLLVSQSLSAIASGSPINDSTATSGTPAFKPSSSAVVVNALLFMSLSLSVAVSLIAILAKEWCYSFMAGRVGSMLKQGRLRQQRWDGIEQWKMREILNVLPLLMHTALLLFAVGLSVYLWDINVAVALPVVITTCLAVLFYMITASLPLFFRFCPYTTALVRLLYPHWIAMLERRGTKNLMKTLVTILAWISHWINRLKQVFRARKFTHKDRSLVVDDVEAAKSYHHGSSHFSFYRHFHTAENVVDNWVELMRGMLLTDRSQLVESKTPMDTLTSSMINWMIAHCEDSRSVDMALQALAGAEPCLPRQPLWECGAIQLVSQRLGACQSTLLSRRAGGQRSTHDSLIDDASLYSRSLNFLTTYTQGEGFELKRMDSPSFALKGTREPVRGLQEATLDVHKCLILGSHFILNHCWDETTPRYEIAAFELGGIPVEADRDSWNFMNQYRHQRTRQWQLMKLITTGEAANLPLSVLVALTNGITKSYLYEPSQSPALLVDLLQASTQPEKPALRHAIAIGLVVATFASHDYPGVAEGSSHTPDTRLRRAKEVYHALVSREMDRGDTETLLLFGLLTLLTNQESESGWKLNEDEIRSVSDVLNHQISLGVGNWITYHHAGRDIIPTLPITFGHTQHLTQVLMGWLSEASEETDSQSEASSPATSCLNALLRYRFCSCFGEHIVVPLAEHFTSAQSVKVKKLCLRGLQYSLTGTGRQQEASFNQLVQTSLLEQLIELTASANQKIAPYCMHFLWVVANELVTNASKSDVDPHPAVPFLLQSFRSKFAVNPTGNGFPASMGDTGLAELWLSNLTAMCRSDPQNVLNSEILKQMIEFYEQDDHRDAKPRITDLPAPFDHSWTWLTILQQLEILNVSEDSEEET